MMSMGLSMRDRDPVDYERSMRSVFVGNIPYEATEDQLKDIFNEVGNVISFRLVFDRESGKPKGYGFAEYQDQETALSAMRNLNQRELHGRQLRVDTATSEKNRTLQEEMAQMGAGGPPAESDFGDPTASKDAPEAISKAVASLPPEQMFELMKQMKQCIQNNPVEARNMLLQNPQLAYALLQAQVVMRIVDPEIAMKMLHRQNPVQPLLGAGDEPRKTPDQERPNGNLPGLGGFPDDRDRPMRDHMDIREVPVDRMMERGPPPPRARMDADLMERVPVDRGEPMDRGRGSPLDRHRPPLMEHPDQFGRDQRHMDRGPRDRGPPSDRHGPMEPLRMSPRDMDRPPMDRRPPMGRDIPPGPPHGRDGPMGRDLPPMGRDMPPMGHPRGGFDRDRGMMDNRGPPRGPPDLNDPRRGRGPPPPDMPAEQDQEKAALIMQVLQLTPQQIEMLPEEQRLSILALKDQLQGRQ